MRTQPARLTPGQRARRDRAIARAYQAGGSAVDVARQCGLSKKGVLDALERLGIPRRPRGGPKGLPFARAAADLCWFCTEPRLPGVNLCAHHQAIVDRMGEEGAA